MPEQVPLPLEFIDLKVLSVDEIWNGASSSLLRRVQEDRRGARVDRLRRELVAERHD